MRNIPTDRSPSLADDERLDEINEDLHLIQKKNGLTYGTDAYLLAAFLRPSPQTHAVELGGGTGVISLLLLAKNKLKSVQAVELQPAFADLIARNAALNRLEGRLTALCGDIRTLTAADTGGEVALVFSNPPYMTADGGRRNEAEEKYIARHEICGSIADFCAAAARILKYGGKFACVWRPDRLADLFRALDAAHLEPKRMTEVYADKSREPACVLVEAVKGGAHGMRVSPPLLLYEERQSQERVRTLTPQAQKIYDTCLFPD